MISKPISSAFLGIRQVSGIISRLYTRGFNTSFSVVNGFGVLELRKPPVNALNKEFLSELRHAFDDSIMKSPNGIVLTSGLKDTFSAGLDFSEVYQRSREDVEAFWREMQSFWMQVYGCQAPVVAAINGHCLAAGCIIAGSSDYRISAKGSYKIGVPAAKVGLVVPEWVLKMLSSIIGPHRTSMIVSKAEVMQPERALELGLIDEVVEQEDLINRAVTILQEFSQVDQHSRGVMKMTLRRDLLEWIDKHKEEDVKHFTSWVCSERIQDMLRTVTHNYKS